MGRKIGGGAVPVWGEIGPHPTQCGLGWGLPPYQVESWCMQPFDHNRHGPKSGGAVPIFFFFFGGGLAGSPLNTMSPRPRPIPSYQMASYPSSRLPTTDMGRKLGCVPLLTEGGAGSPSNTVWPGPMTISIPSAILIRQTRRTVFTNGCLKFVARVILLEQMKLDISTLVCTTSDK